MASMMQAQTQLRRTSSRLHSVREGHDYLAVPTSAEKSNGEAGEATAPRQSDLVGLANILLGQPVLSLMLLFIPVGYAAHYQNWDPPFIFGFNFLAVVPLAWLIGKSTEDVAAACGQTLGGLLNATFGNTVEMLICVAGIMNDEIAVVQCTLLGSILSNLLLVLGTAFLVGGVWYTSQKYSQAGAATQCSLMYMAVFAIGLPTIYASILPQDVEQQHMLHVSRWTSVFLLITYCAYLYFQLGSHSSIFEEEGGSDEEDPPDLSPCSAAILLAIATFVTSGATEFLVGAIKGTVATWDLSQEFIGIIMLPIIGNAAEHYTAITVAARNKMDLSMGVAAGSSCQMALLVTPVTVLVGWGLGKEMTLNFHPFQLCVLYLAVHLVSVILHNGTSNWLEGMMLLITYLILSLMYFFEGNSPQSSLTHD